MYTIQANKQMTCNNVFSYNPKQYIHILKYNSMTLLLMAKLLSKENQNDRLALISKKFAASQAFAKVYMITYDGFVGNCLFSRLRSHGVVLQPILNPIWNAFLLDSLKGCEAHI